MPIRLTQVGVLGDDSAYVKLPLASVGVSASFPFQPAILAGGGFG